MRVSEMMMLPVTVSPCVVDEVSKTHPHLMPSNNTHIYSINIHYSHSRRNVITRLSSNLRWDHPQMRAFSYACSLPVTWQTRLHQLLISSFYRATANAYARSCYRCLSVCLSICQTHGLWQNKIIVCQFLHRKTHRHRYTHYLLHLALLAHMQ